MLLVCVPSVIAVGITVIDFILLILQPRRLDIYILNCLDWMFEIFDVYVLVNLHNDYQHNLLYPHAIVFVPLMFSLLRLYPDSQVLLYLTAYCNCEYSGA